MRVSPCAVFACASVVVCATIFHSDFSKFASATITCTAQSAPNAKCKGAHAENQNLSGPTGCVGWEDPPTYFHCGYTGGSCNGDKWQIAVKGLCPADEQPVEPRNNCILDYGVTNVTIDHHNLACGFSPSPGATCGCQGYPVINPLTGLPETDIKEVCDCH